MSINMLCTQRHNNIWPFHVTVNKKLLTHEMAINVPYTQRHDNIQPFHVNTKNNY